MEHTPAQPAPAADPSAPSASPPPAEPAGPPLPTALSWALVAFIVEFDNEFEHRMPHRTTRHGVTGGLARPPWLVSMAMWAHCMRHVPPAGGAAATALPTTGLPTTGLPATGLPATGLPGLVSQALLAFALDFEGESDLSLGQYTAAAPARLAVSANVLRVLDGPGVRVSDVPALTGVAKMAVDNWLGSLQTHGYLAIGPDPAGRRFKVATLTASGRRAQDAYRHWAGAAGHRWQDRFGAQPIATLDSAVRPWLDADLLRQGTEPYPDGWRAAVRRPGTLPYYPVISARGGFPDGS